MDSDVQQMEFGCPANGLVCPQVDKWNPDVQQVDINSSKWNSDVHKRTPEIFFGSKQQEKMMHEGREIEEELRRLLRDTMAQANFRLQKRVVEGWLAGASKNKYNCKLYS
jgi:hypothetical protein